MRYFVVQDSRYIHLAKMETLRNRIFKVYMQRFFNCLVYIYIYIYIYIYVYVSICHRISTYNWYSDYRKRLLQERHIPGHYFVLLFLGFLLSFKVRWYTNASLKSDFYFDGSVLRSGSSTCRQQVAQRATLAHLSPACPEGQIWSFQPLQVRQETPK